jgi:hypothetical protein
MLILVGYLMPHSHFRAIMLMTAFLSVMIGHLKIIKESKQGIAFIIVGFLWAIKLVSHIVIEGIYFAGHSVMILESIDLSLLFLIFILVAVSFILLKPFWYKKTTNRKTIMIGLLSLVFLMWFIAQAIFSYFDFYFM